MWEQEYRYCINIILTYSLKYTRPLRNMSVVFVANVYTNRIPSTIEYLRTLINREHTSMFWKAECARLVPSLCRSAHVYRNFYKYVWVLLALYHFNKYSNTIVTPVIFESHLYYLCSLLVFKLHFGCKNPLYYLCPSKPLRLPKAHSKFLESFRSFGYT